MNAHDYAQTHAARFYEQLLALLRIPSISTLKQHAPDVRRAAEWLRADMQRIGLRAQIFQRGHYLPLLYGEWLGAPNAPTVLIYCHYDVQPAALEDGWTSDPFTPTERDGKLYARGALDSKMHVIAHLKALEALLATGQPPVNVKLLFEGEEESGSEHIFQFVAENHARLACDVCVISDGSMYDPQQPLLVYGLRGVTTYELRVFGPKADLHSGAYGGTVHNPIQALAEMLAQLHDAQGRVNVPGFYDDVRPLSADERAALAAVGAWVEKDWQHTAAAPQPWGEADYALQERIGARPTLEINGIAGGFAGEGFKTAIPSKASAKISCRLVPDQDPQRIYQCVRDYLAAITPPTVRSELIELEAGAPALLVERANPAMQAVAAAYERAWGRAPLWMREGGSVPVASVLQQALHKPLVMLPFGYKGGRAHGPDEYIFPEMFHKGIAAALYFYAELAERLRHA
ncbi:MAG: dipeptidase [Chloroflexi bacterium]|nr:dipeptidase [Chloroflexota bacterium]